MPAADAGDRDSPKASTPTRVAATGSRLAMMDALPDSTRARPRVYRMYGATVENTTSPRDSSHCRGLDSAAAIRSGRKRPHRHGHRAVAGQGAAAENAVQGVEEPGPQAQQDAPRRHRQVPGEDAADQRAAQQGQPQGQELLFCHRLAPKNRRQHHHKGRRGVQQNGRRRQGADPLAGEVTHREQQHADHASAEEVFQVLPADAEHAPVPHGEHRGQQKHSAEVPHHHDVCGSEAPGHQVSVPQADDPPQHRRPQNGGIGAARPGGLFILHHGSSHTSLLPPLK